MFKEDQIIELGANCPGFFFYLKSLCQSSVLRHSNYPKYLKSLNVVFTDIQKQKKGSER